jgi:hypothetical protein
LDESVKVRIRDLTRGTTYWDGGSWVDIEKWVLAIGSTAWTYDTSGIWSSGHQYELTSKARDKAVPTPNEEVPSTSKTFVFDINSPTATVVTPSEGAKLKNLSTISGTCQDDWKVDKVELEIKNITDSPNEYWTGSSWSTTTSHVWADVYTSSWTYIFIGNWSSGREHSITAKAQDKVPNFQVQLSTRTFTIDKDVPTVSVTSPIGDMKEAPDKVSGGAVDHPDSPLKNSGISKVEIEIKDTTASPNVYWDGSVWVTTGTWFDIGSTSWEYTVPQPSTTWTDGHLYRLQAKATDGTGENAGLSSYVTFRYDKTEPSSQVSVPGDGKYYPYGQPSTLSGTAQDPSPSSGVDNVKVLVQRIDTGEYWNGSEWKPEAEGEKWNPVTSFISPDWTYTISNPTATWLNGKSYAVKSKAEDKAGNIEVVVSSNVFSYDTSEPSCSVDYPGDGDKIKDKVTLRGSCSDNFKVAVASVSVQRAIGWWTGSGWDSENEHWLGATLSPNATSWWWYDDDMWSAEVNYTIRVKAIDNAGNEKISSSNTFLYDPNPPDSNVSVPVNNKFYRSLPEISGTSVDGVSGSGVTLVKVKITDLTNPTTYYWNGENGWTTTEAGTWFNMKSGPDPWKYYLGTSTATSNGYWTSGNKYKIQCKAYDLAGNEETTFGEAIYYFDNKPSTSVVNVPINGDSYNSLPEISGSASDGGSGTYPAGVDYVEVRIKNPDGDSWDETNKSWGSEVWNVVSGSTSWSLSITTSAWISDKVYTINSRAYDKVEYPSSNVEINYSTYTFIYDVVKPTSAVTQPVDGRYYSSLTLIKGTSYDKMTGVDTTEISIQRYNDPFKDYYWNGSTWTVVESWLPYTGGSAINWQLSVSTSAWKSGDRYRIKSRAKDKTKHSVNIEDVSTKPGNIFTLDNIAPASTIVQPEAK